MIIKNLGITLKINDHLYKYLIECKQLNRKVKLHLNLCKRPNEEVFELRKSQCTSQHNDVDEVIEKEIEKPVRKIYKKKDEDGTITYKDDIINDCLNIGKRDKLHFD